MEFKTLVWHREPRTSVRRQPDGTVREYVIKGGWYYRIKFNDPGGKPRTRESGGYKSERTAKSAMEKTFTELQEKHGVVEGKNMTFNDLADYMERVHYKTAVYEDGYKTEGVRSLKSVRTYIKHLREYFGTAQIDKITTQGLRDYRNWRKQPSRTYSQRKSKSVSPATINRELATMRVMVRTALAEGWIRRDPFYNAKVIHASAEKGRERIISRLEERRLLAACSGEWITSYDRIRFGKTEKVTARIKIDDRLKAIVTLALDTGMRLGELLKLKWDEIDFEAGIITVLSTNTKTQTQRQVPLTRRSTRELKAIENLIGEDRRPFPYAEIKRQFRNACRLAGLKDIRFHDLRRTASDRITERYGLETAAGILGHTQMSTTLKHYVNKQKAKNIADVREWLDNEHSEDKVPPIEGYQGIRVESELLN